MVGYSIPTELKLDGLVVVQPVGEDMRYHYHNTTESSGQTLDLYEHRASSQEQNILNWFKHYQRPHRPSQIQKLLFYGRVPITSVRRAMSNLTEQGELGKSTEQVKGPYGRPEYKWKLPGGQQRLF